MSKSLSVTRLHNLSGHHDAVYNLVAGAEKHIFYSAAGDGMVVEWNLNKPELGKLLLKVPASIYALYRNAQSNELIIGQNYDGIRLYDLDNKKEIKSVKITTAAIFDITMHGNLIFVATGDGVIVVLDRESLAVKKHIKTSEKSVRSLSVKSEQNLLVAGFSDHFIRYFDLDTLMPVGQFKAHENSVFSVRFMPGTDNLLSVSRDARLKIWDALNQFELTNEIVAHMYAINHLDFSPDAKHFVTCSMDKSIKVWESQDCKLIKVIDKSRHAGHGTSVNRVLWTEVPGIIVSASDDRSISVWKLEFKEN
jgi:WD repeat-containing protein 61